MMNRKAFLAALSAVRPGLASREIVEQSMSFVFEPDRVMTYNDETFMVHPLESGLQGAVPAEVLYNLIRKLPDDEIELDIKDNHLIISGKQRTADLFLEAELRLPVDEIPRPDNAMWKEIPEGFAKACTLALTSVAKNLVRPALAGVLFSRDKVVSSDGMRITHIDYSLPVHDLVVPAATLETVLKFSPTHVASDEGWIHFRTGGSLQMSSRTIAAAYPETSGLVDIKGEKIEFPTATKDIVDRAATVLSLDDDSSALVELILEDNKMQVIAEGTAGKFIEEIRLRYKGPEIHALIKPKFLIEALPLVRTATLGDNLRFDGDGWLHVVWLPKRESSKA